MVVRTQVTLDTEAHRRAKQRAAELGISFSEYIRRVVDEDLGEPTPRADISQIFGLISSGGSDVARYKDRYVDEAVRDLHR
jgi:hypothetical protein